MMTNMNHIDVSRRTQPIGQSQLARPSVKRCGDSKARPRPWTGCPASRCLRKDAFTDHENRWSGESTTAADDDECNPTSIDVELHRRHVKIFASSRTLTMIRGHWFAVAFVISTCSNEIRPACL